MSHQEIRLQDWQNRARDRGDSRPAQACQPHASDPFSAALATHACVDHPATWSWESAGTLRCAPVLKLPCGQGWHRRLPETAEILIQAGIFQRPSSATRSASLSYLSFGSLILSLGCMSEAPLPTSRLRSHSLHALANPALLPHAHLRFKSPVEVGVNDVAGVDAIF